MEHADTGVGHAQDSAAIGMSTNDRDLLLAFALSVLVWRRGSVDVEDVLENRPVLVDCEDWDLLFRFRHF